MEKKEFLKEERATLLHNLVEKIKSFLDHHPVKGELSSKIFIYQRLADFTYYSEVSIRKFLTGTIPKDLSSFLNGIRNYGKLIGFSEEEIEKFIKDYSEASNTIILEKSSLTKTQHNLPPVDLSSIVVPKKLENFLDSFFKDSINISYIFGYKLSGKTKSVMTYLNSLISKNVYENILFIDIKQGNNQVKQIIDSIINFIDIDLSVEEERKKEECFQFLKKSHSILTLDFNHISIDATTLEFIKKISSDTKVILLTLDSFKMQEEKFLSYCKVFCTNDCFEEEEFERVLKNRKESISNLLGKEFISKLYRLTGGVPYLALSILKKIEEENKLGLPLEEALTKYSSRKNSLYDSFAEKIISDSWNQMDLLAKKILITVAKFNHSVSLKFLSFLLSQDKKSEKWKNSLMKCYDYYLLDAIFLPNPRVYMNNMIKTLVLQYEEKEGLNHQEFLNGISKYYLELATSIGECYNDLEKLKLLDDFDEWEFVKEVLTYLEESDRKREYIKIVKELKYYLYVRGIWQVGKDSLHLKRATMAKELDLTDDYVEALCDYINICSKSKNDKKAFAYLQTVEKVVEENTVISPRVMCLYYHVKALYLYNCEKNYRISYEIWKNNEVQYAKDISRYRRLVNELWLTRSYIQMEKDDKKIVSVLEEKIKKMEEENFVRAQLDYELLLIGVLSNQIESFEKSMDILERISRELAKCEILLKTKSVKDIRNEAKFFHYKAILSTYLHDFSKRDVYLEKANEDYQLMNDQEDMEELKKKIEQIEGK